MKTNSFPFQFAVSPDSLIGRSFVGNASKVGYVIEAALGGNCDTRCTSDLDGCEIKTRKEGSRSRITLGGKQFGTVEDLYNQVFNKMKVVVVVRWEATSENTFTVVGVDYLWNLNHEKFYSGDYFTVEYHHNQSNIRAMENAFYQLYDNVIYS